MNTELWHIAASLLATVATVGLGVILYFAKRHDTERDRAVATSAQVATQEIKVAILEAKDELRDRLDGYLTKDESNKIEAERMRMHRENQHVLGQIQKEQKSQGADIKGQREMIHQIEQKLAGMNKKK